MGRSAGEICESLVEAFECRHGIFSDTKELLENQIPIGVTPLGREHANFLFFLIAQDHGVRSATLYEKAKRLYVSNPEYFDPEGVRRLLNEDWRHDGMLPALQSLGVRYPANGAKAWAKNAFRLAQDFDCDARTIFRGPSQEVMSTIRSFLGFGPKTGGLLYRVFAGLGMYAPSEGDGAVTFPTDIHDTRIAALTGLADIPTSITEKTYSRYVRQAERVWREGAAAAAVNWHQLDRALWILGSKGCATERHFDCPIRDDCSIGRMLLL